MKRKYTHKGVQTICRGAGMKSDYGLQSETNLFGSVPSVCLAHKTARGRKGELMKYDFQTEVN